MISVHFDLIYDKLNVRHVFDGDRVQIFAVAEYFVCK
jgi:hypothetical protein